MMNNNEKNLNEPIMGKEKNNGGSTENGSQKVEKISNEDCGNASAGYAGSQKYSEEIYAKYGIHLEKNVWSKDKFYIGRTGTPITKEEANQIVDKKRLEDLTNESNPPRHSEWWRWD